MTIGAFKCLLLPSCISLHPENVCWVHHQENCECEVVASVFGSNSGTLRGTSWGSGRFGPWVVEEVMCQQSQQFFAMGKVNLYTDASVSLAKTIRFAESWVGNLPSLPPKKKGERGGILSA